jgi:sporulation protein YlmC with PRC-barrel domain
MSNYLAKVAFAAALAAGLPAAAYAQQTTTTTTGVVTPSQMQTLNQLPQAAMTVTNWYKQDVYDPSDNKIGEIADVLVGRDGKVDAFIVSVGGGFFGIDQKDVAVPFDAVRRTERNGKWYLTMDATKDGLKSAHGYKYDRAKQTWDPA